MKAKVMTFCRPFFFFFSPFLSCCLLRYFPPHRPHTGVFFLFVLFLFVRRQLSSSCCFVRANLSSCCFARAKGICFSSARMVFLLQPFLSFPIFSHHVLQNTCRLFCFALFCFFCSLSSFLFFFFSFFLWCGLFCVLVPGALVLHLPYLDKLRLFGLLCFTAVCDHRICISLG